MKAYLYINSILYIVFAIWCAVSPEWTASAVGLVYPGNQGFAEYVAVYGGLEFGVGMFFLLCALKPNLQVAGVLFGACFYLGIFVFRTIAILEVGLDIGNGINFYITETIFAVWSCLLALRK